MDLLEKVELFLECKRLDCQGPIYVSVMEQPQLKPMREVGQTEVLDGSNINIKFTTSVKMSLQFEVRQNLKFHICSPQSNKKGEMHCTLGEIVGSHNKQLVKKINKEGDSKSDIGLLVVRVEKFKECNDMIKMRILGYGIKDPTGMFGSFKPVLTIDRITNPNTNTEDSTRVYRSEQQKGKNPSFNGFQIPVQKLCNNDYHRPLRFKVYHNHKNGHPEEVGQLTTCIQEILDEIGRSKKPLIPLKHKGKKIGSLEFYNFEIMKIPTFLDFIVGGCEICLMVAIDFTQSNGDCHNPGSLHYLSQTENKYEAALRNVGEILLNYDTDKKVPVFGFGAKAKGAMFSSHCFPLNQNEGDPEVEGMEGMLRAYRETLYSMEMSGPTLFGDLLTTTIKYARKAEEQMFRKGEQSYYVLLILTDGQINDMSKTVDLIVQASVLPLSIVIVGIGNENFEKMTTLDADEVPLVDKDGKHMQRDIVQFVPFREFNDDPLKLTEEVLEEIPEQITSYFKLKHMAPNEPVDVGGVSEEEVKEAFRRGNTLHEQAINFTQMRRGTGEAAGGMGIGMGMGMGIGMGQMQGRGTQSPYPPGAQYPPPPPGTQSPYPNPQASPPPPLHKAATLKEGGPPSYGNYGQYGNPQPSAEPEPIGGQGHMHNMLGKPINVPLPLPVHVQPPSYPQGMYIIPEENKQGMGYRPAIMKQRTQAYPQSVPMAYDPAYPPPPGGGPYPVYAPRGGAPHTHDPYGKRYSHY